MAVLPENTAEPEKIVAMVGITKSFPGVKALENINFDIGAGEVHALVGENGAGKSTLIKILMGALAKDSGTIFINGEKTEIDNPAKAKTLGMSAVYQDVMLAQHLTVGENFFLGVLPQTRFRTVDWYKIHSTAAKVLKELNIDINSKELVKNLTVAKQEMVVIAKTLYLNSKVVVFDEPTALLASDETEELFQLILRLKEKGVGIVYISHRMEEIFRIADRVTVLKDGKFVGTFPTSETSEDALISMMVGRSISDMYSIGHSSVKEEVVLEVKGLSKNGVFRDIAFKLHKGEILGMFGLVGSGRTDIARCIFGADPYDNGEIYVNGEKSIIKSPRDSIGKGICLLPEDRKKQGLCLGLSVGVNINLAQYPQITKLGVIDAAKEKETAQLYKDDLDIRTPSIDQKVRNLSGGNQQKVVIAKWLCKDCRLFIFDEPTVGVDVGAKAEIYKLLERLVAEGNALIMISSYLPEIMGIADRIMVISEGRDAGTLKRSEYINMAHEDEERMLKMASGLTLR